MVGFGDRAHNQAEATKHPDRSHISQTVQSAELRENLKILVKFQIYLKGHSKRKCSTRRFVIFRKQPHIAPSQVAEDLNMLLPMKQFGSTNITTTMVHELSEDDFDRCNATSSLTKLRSG